MMFSVIKYLFQMISQDCERNSKSVGYEKCLGELVDYDDKMREELKISSGSPFPLGATFDGKGTNFALFSSSAQKVMLCLFDLLLY